MNSCASPGDKPSKQIPDSFEKLAEDCARWARMSIGAHSEEFERMTAVEHRIKLLLMPKPQTGPEYPHKSWCDQVVADMGRRGITEEEALGFFTAQLFEYMIRNEIPKLRDSILADATGRTTQTYVNLQTMMKTAVRVAQGMSMDVRNIMARHKTPTLAQSSICLKKMGTDGDNTVLCSLAKSHKGDCA